MEYDKDKKDKAREQYQRLALAADICAKASRLAMQAVEHSETLTISTAFEQALKQTLEQTEYNRDELTSVWAMLMLGAQAVKKVCNETDSYILGSRDIQHRGAEYIEDQ